MKKESLPSGTEAITNSGLAIYLFVSLFVTWLCGGGLISLIIVCIFFFLSIGKPIGSMSNKTPTSSYVFDHADDDSDSD